MQRVDRTRMCVGLPLYRDVTTPRDVLDWRRGDHVHELQYCTVRTVYASDATIPCFLTASMEVR
jgi:hypothetical protein